MCSGLRMTLGCPTFCVADNIRAVPNATTSGSPWSATSTRSSFSAKPVGQQRNASLAQTKPTSGCILVTISSVKPASSNNVFGTTNTYLLALPQRAPRGQGRASTQGSAPLGKEEADMSVSNNNNTGIDRDGSDDLTALLKQGRHSFACLCGTTWISSHFAPCFQ